LPVRPCLRSPRSSRTLRLVCSVLLFPMLMAACQPLSTPTPMAISTTVVGDPAQPAQSAIPSTVTPRPTIPPSPTASPTLPLTSPTPVPVSPTAPPVTTLLFTGVIVPARCVQAAIDASGDPDAIYDEVRQVIQSADLAVGTLNATMSNYPPHTGCTPTYVLVGNPENADALSRAGFDVMSVATNHIKNCGPTNCGNRAFFDTLDNLRRVGIMPVGAGANHAEAMQPVVVTVNGIRFGFVSLGQIEPMAFATDARPGIAVLNEANLHSAIAAARGVSDVVIAMPHWGPEDVPMPNWSQRTLARQAVEAGADLVVGNHTHVVQGVQQIDGTQVFYGLGNFVFDQWPRDHQQGVILQVRFVGDRYDGYEFIPTHVDRDGRVHIAAPDEAAEILERIRQVSEDIAP
jgi:Bacterial capsule synthesis protein PGA_cap